MIYQLIKNNMEKKKKRDWGDEEGNRRRAYILKGGRASLLGTQHLNKEQVRNSPRCHLGEQEPKKTGAHKPLKLKIHHSLSGISK